MSTEVLFNFIIPFFFLLRYKSVEVPRVPAAGCPAINTLLPSAYLIFWVFLFICLVLVLFVCLNLGFFCHPQMKTNFEILVFVCDRNPLFLAVPTAVCSVLNRGNTGDAAVTLSIAYGRGGYHCE